MPLKIYAHIKNTDPFYLGALLGIIWEEGEFLEIKFPFFRSFQLDELLPYF